MERDTGVAPVTSPWQGDELLLHQTRNKQHSALTVQELTCCYNKEYSTIVAGAPTGNCTPTVWMETTSSAIKL